MEKLGVEPAPEDEEDEEQGKAEEVNGNGLPLARFAVASHCESHPQIVRRHRIRMTRRGIRQP